MDANTKIIHVPKHTDDNFTVESWYATITGPDRDYAGLKVGLIDLLVSEGDGFDLYTAEVQDLDGILSWHVVSVKELDLSAFDTDLHYYIVTVMTETGDKVLQLGA
ncbi:MAG: hypothetical protein KAQ85_00050 [Thermodesulfovibrionia bacterium]|nr:hypothetical protein [Thermodesulfovibrionia bacterium]